MASTVGREVWRRRRGLEARYLRLLLSLHAVEVRLDHHRDELLERHRRLPTELRRRLRRVGDEKVDFRRTKEALVLHHELPIVEAHAADGGIAELANRVGLAH